jgi:hypothetical protein
MKLTAICNCPKCGEPINLPIKLLGQIIASQRKAPIDKAHLSRAGKKGSEVRWGKKN